MDGLSNYHDVLYFRLFALFIFLSFCILQTKGMVVSCLIKEIQITSELKKMAEIDLVSKDVIDSLIKQKFEAPIPKNQDDDDPFIKGEFDVIKELLEKVLG